MFEKFCAVGVPYVMLLFGRLSLRIVWPAVNVAGEPVLVAVSVQFHD